MANARQFMAARTAAWAKSGSGMPTARDYVHDGLIAMWDGSENAGWGLSTDHDIVDLIGNHGTFIGPVLDGHFDGVGSVPVVTDLVMCMEVVIDLPPVDNYVIITNGITHYPNSFGIYSWNGFIAFINALNIGNRSVRYIPGLSAFSINYGSVDRKFYDVKSNGGDVELFVSDSRWSTYDELNIGQSYKYRPPYSRVYSLRLYGKNLTQAEIAANYAVDKARFGLP